MDETEAARAARLIAAARVIRNWGKLPPVNSPLMRELEKAGLVFLRSGSSMGKRLYALSPTARRALVEDDKRMLLESFVVGYDPNLHASRATADDAQRREIIGRGERTFVRDHLAAIDSSEFADEEELQPSGYAR